MAAALAVGVLLAGACSSGGDDDVAAGDRPKLPAASGGGGATARDAAAAAPGGSELMLYPERAVEYRLASGAKAPATSAPGYRIDADDVSDDDASRMARVFGLDGEVQRDGSAYVARSGPAEFRVDTTGLGSWSYIRDPERSVSSVAVACPPGADCPAPEPPAPIPGLPSAAEAEDKAREVLDDLGVDIDDLRFETVDSDAGSPRSVGWTRLVDGVEVYGFGGTMAFGEQGRVEYANDSLGRFEKVGDYPLVSMDEAVERLRTGFGGGPRAMATDTPAIAQGAAGAAEGTDVGVAQGEPGGGGQSSPGSPGEVPPAPPDAPPPAPPTTAAPQIVEITGARVVLLVAYGACPDDPVYAVPAFAFAPEEAGVAVAVEQDALDTGDDVATSDPITCPGVVPGTEPAGKPEPAPLPAEDLPAPAPDRP
jgi:hypothetical protein